MRGIKTLLLATALFTGLALELVAKKEIPDKNGSISAPLR